MDRNQQAEIIRRIPILKNFSEEQVLKVLAICAEEAFAEGSALFKEGEESTSIYILLSGMLQVQTPTGGEIATIGKMGVVGEMGVLTDLPRAASVVALKAATTLNIQKELLFGLILQDQRMGYLIYQNVTYILAQRLRDNNILLEQQYLVLDDLVGGGRGGL